MISTCFESIGAYVPERRVSTQSIIDSMDFKPPFDLEAITGIRERRVCSSVEDSFTLALQAAQDCLSRSSYKAAELEVIISTSICRFKGKEKNYWEPSFALFLAKELGATRAIHFDVSNACAGMMSGVLFLDRLIKAGIVKNGLVVSGEYISPIAETAIKEIAHPFDAQFASLTVGDAAAAVIMHQSSSEQDRIHYIELLTCAEYSHLCIGKPSEVNGGPALYTNNKEMHKEERVQLWPRFQKDFLAKRGCDFASEQYDYLIHHQVGAKAMKNFSKFGTAIFETQVDESLSLVEDFANTASTSHFLVLYRHLKEQRLKKGAKFLMVPAASGVVTGCLSVTISSLEL